MTKDQIIPSTTTAELRLSERVLNSKYLCLYNMIHTTQVVARSRLPPLMYHPHAVP